MKKKADFVERKRNRRNTGQRKYVNILVPEELKQELELYKDTYAVLFDRKVSFEQMFRRWLANVKKFDRAVAVSVDSSKTSRAEFAKQREALREQAREMIDEPVKGVKKAKSEQKPKAKLEAKPKERKKVEVVEKDYGHRQYFYVKGMERLEARFSKGKGSFAATQNGRNLGYAQMAKDGWHLEDEYGNTYDEQQAVELKEKYDPSKNRCLPFSFDFEDYPETIFSEEIEEMFQERQKDQAKES